MCNSKDDRQTMGKKPMITTQNVGIIDDQARKIEMKGTQWGQKMAC